MKFTERFGIEVGLEEAQKRFVNRIHNRVYLGFLTELDSDVQWMIHRGIASALGDLYDNKIYVEQQIGRDFLRNLHALETLYKAYSIIDGCKEIDSLIKLSLSESEVDLGIRWENGKFIPSGAKLLDDELVNKALHWLKDRKHENVLVPFEKGLSHFLHSEKRPELLSDVITDMYEALEALAKIVTERPDKDLSANKELFISKINASSEYKKILSEYINYANNFRHAADGKNQKPELNKKEVESFVYLTGLFIRLAIP